MKTIQYNNITTLPSSCFDQKDVEYLQIKHSNFNLPANLNSLKQLRELQVIDCTIENIPNEVFDLEHTFFFFEGVQPAVMQLVPTIIFDYQRKKIDRKLAEFLLDLLQNRVAGQNDTTIALALTALDHKFPEIQDKALNWLHQHITPPASIPAGAMICIQGKPGPFHIKDIKSRLASLQVKLQQKTGPSVTHIVLGVSPDWKGKLPVDKILLTDRQFFEWLNKTDQLFLAVENEENKTSRQHIAAMLHSEDPVNQELALQMLKTNGVSKDLLTDLLCYYHQTPNKTLRQKAKTIFKQSAPEEVLQFLKNNKARGKGALETYLDDSIFINWVEDNAHFDLVRIALLKQNFRNFIKYCSAVTLIKIFTSLVKDDTLVLPAAYNEKMPSGILNSLPIKSLVCIETQAPAISHEILKSLEQIESLDITNSQYRNSGLPADMSSLMKLKHVRLGQLEHFPEGLLTIPNLETVRMQLLAFSRIPKLANWPSSLKSIVVVHQYWEAVDETLKERASTTIPEGCSITFEKMVKK